MTNPSSNAWHHYNHESWGPLHIYVSATTGKRLGFRANEILQVRKDAFDRSVVKTVSGCEFKVKMGRPEVIPE